MSRIQFTVNGKKCVVDQSTSRATTLNAYLRYTLGLPGTKAMCHEGGCGACVVAVRARRPTSGRVELFSVNSCLVLVYCCHEWEITTIEGLGNRRDGYDDIQKRIAAFHATQCGYCTPGWAMHLHSLRDKSLTMAEMEKAFASNTCRCTGFRPIMDTVKSFAVDASPDLCQRVADIEDLQICAKTNSRCDRKCSTHSNDSGWTYVSDEIANIEDYQTTIALTEESQKFYKVYDEQEIFKILNNNGTDTYMFIDGNTVKGIYEDFEYPRILLDVSSVSSLKKYSYDQNLVLGANISLEDCIGIFKEAAETRSEFAYLSGFVKHLQLVGNMPVRKIGSLAGNLMLKHSTPTFASDVFVLLETVGAFMTIRNRSQEKTLTMQKFLKQDMKGWLIVKVALPPLNSSHTFTSYKIMPRHQNASAIVNAGFLIKKDQNSNLISEASIVFGNISPDFIHASRTEKYLKGRNVFKNETLKGAIDMLNQEINPVDSPPQPSKECRKKLAIGLFYKFILSISPSNLMSSRVRSGGSIIPRPVSKGTQDFQTDESLYPLNQPVPKLEAMIQSAGEAEYANDVPLFPNEVFGAFVLSTVHRGQVDFIDIEKILKTEGVLAVYTAKNISGKNSFTRPGYQLQTHDEEILATDIKFYGQPIAILVANTQELAARAAKKVEVTYKNVGSAPPVLTIDQAKRDSKRYTAFPDHVIEPKSRGDNVTKVIKGVYEIQSQYHYYMEPISCVVVPVDDKLEVYDSTQWINLTQTAIAQSLGEKESNIIVKCRRVGGGFGGKISRNAQAASACALIARKMNLPARFILPMQTNLTISGKRLSCQCDYEVGVDVDGKIQYLNATVIEDDGCSHNENVLAFTINGFPNCYDKDSYSLKTAAVLTDLPSNTFARAPGTSEGMACIENIMEHIAFALKKDSTEVRKINMKKDNNDLPILIEEFKKDTDYDKRAKEVEQFNMVNRWMKKAIQISVMAFPVIFYGNYSAMVSIYRGDGTVTVTTCGNEMGQGLNTKVAQVCAYELGIPLENVSVLPQFSFTSANNVFSGASIASESACYATKRACQMLKERLAPVKEKMSNPTWQELVVKAGEEMVDMTATYMMSDQEEDLSGYTAWAVAILEVQLDVLTGRFELLRVDILEDVGLSTNPKLDVGQVEGGYMQGIGYFTSEKLVFDQSTGKLLSNRALTYHVPLALDIPAIFNIKLRYNSDNPKGVLGSKAVGEMGVCTAHGVTHALRRCIQESRRDSGYDTTEWINISVPYNTESILKALDVKLDEMIITNS